MKCCWKVRKAILLESCELKQELREIDVQEIKVGYLSLSIELYVRNGKVTYDSTVM